jgi:transcriptional regulator with XRE-family HTH domain
VSPYRRPEPPDGLDPIITELKDLRMKAGLTQRDLAERLYCSQAAVCSWECGGRTPDVAMLRRWAEALGVGLRLGPRFALTADVPAAAYAQGWDDCARTVVAAARRDGGVR